MARPFMEKEGGDLQNAAESAGIWTWWDLGLVETTSDQQKEKLNLKLKNKKIKGKNCPKIISNFFFNIYKRKFYPYWS